MSAREYTLLGGLVVRVEDGAFVDLKFPKSETWANIAKDRVTIDVLISILRAECDDADRRRHR